MLKHKKGAISPFFVSDAKIAQASNPYWSNFVNHNLGVIKPNHINLLDLGKYAESFYKAEVHFYYNCSIAYHYYILCFSM